MKSEPAIRYLICTTPRSGSTYLCHVLSQTGVLGMQPYDERRFEYCKRFLQAGMSRRDWWRVPHLESVFDDGFSESATPNGVGGFKVMWEHLDRVSDAAARNSARGEDRAAFERRLAAETRFIWLRRRDELAQAISWNRALQSDSWHYLAERRFDGRLIYDFPGIALGVWRVRRSNAAWSRFFRRVGAEPLTLDYEDYLEDVPGAVRRIAGHLGVELEGSVSESSGTLRRQRDELNREWARRYRADSANPIRAAAAVLRAVGSHEWRASYRNRRSSQAGPIGTSRADRPSAPGDRGR